MKWIDLWIFIRGGLFIWIMAAVGIFAIWWFSRDDAYFRPATRVIVDFEDAIRGGIDCYDLPPVKWVRKSNTGACPDSDIVQKVINDFMKDTGTMPEDIKRAKIWFTGQPINCLNCDKCRSKVTGCTNGFDVAVFLRDYAEDWGETLKVELCHVREMARNNDLDGDHLASCYPAGSITPGSRAWKLGKEAVF